MRAALPALAAALLCPAAPAQDRATEFAPFAHERPAATRGAPPTPAEWERRRRLPADFGPPWLGTAEQQLLEAARASRWADVLALLKAGRVNVNIRDARGGGVLALAARDGHDAAVRELLARGADRDHLSHEGFTPLGAAAFYGRRSTLRLLLRAGADPRVFGASGQTPLHLAAMAGHVGLVDELLAGGVDAGLLNRARATALEVAAERGQQDTMRRLMEAAAR